MARLAHLISVSRRGLSKRRAEELGVVDRLASDQDGEEYEFSIDGEPFPFYLSEEGVQTSVARGLPGVTITIPADRVEIVHDLDKPKAE